MVSKSVKKVKKKSVKKSVKTSPWFERKDGLVSPIGCGGWISFFVFVLFNVFSVWYFYREGMVLDDYLKIGTVFLLSSFVLIEVVKFHIKRGRK